jgi:hypothetical protein
MMMPVLKDNMQSYKNELDVMIIIACKLSGKKNNFAKQ